MEHVIITVIIFKPDKYMRMGKMCYSVRDTGNYNSETINLNSPNVRS